MSPENVLFLNFGLHSLAFGFLGWLLLSCLIRDALRRSVSAMMAILFSVGGPWLVSSLPPLGGGRDMPALTALHQTLDSGWSIVIRQEMSPATSTQTITPDVSNFVRYGDRWMFWLKWICLSGTVILLFRHLWQTVRIVVWRRGLRKPTPEEIESIPQALRGKPLAVFHHPGTPCVVGWFRPLIAVPASSFGTLTARQWHWLVLHEEEHLRGRDTLVSWFLECARSVLWWNPFIHALIECHARAREEICDAAAVREAGGNKDYAEFLLSWVRACHPMAGVMPMAQSRPAQRLRGRLTALVEARPIRHRLGVIFLLACTAGAVIGPLLIASIGLAVSTDSAAAQPVKSASLPGENSSLFTRTYVVSPNILSSPSNPANKVTPREFLESKGIPFPKHAMAIFQTNTSHLQVTNTLANLEKTRQVLNTASMIQPQVYFVTRFIQADRFFGIHGAVLDNKSAAALIANVSQKAGIDVLSAPRVTTKMGQRAVVEVGHFNPANPEQLVGIRQELVPSKAAGGKVFIDTKSSFGLEPGEKLISSKFSLPKDWSQVKVYTRNGRAELASGETLVQNLQVGGKQMTLLIAATALLPDGTETSHFEEVANVRWPVQVGSDIPYEPGAAPIEQNTSPRIADKKVFLSVAVADVPEVSQLAASLGWDGKEKVEPDRLLGVLDSHLNGQFLVTGVLTEAQFSLVMRALGKQQGASIVALPGGAVENGKEAVFHLPENLGGQPFAVTPRVWADGYTIDLNVAPPSLDHAPKKAVTTAVTIWPSQTLILGGYLREVKDQGRLIFVTASLIEENGKATQ
ncbi:M56 family metallopeptidase [Prosthecobacter dejongeii]|uniref:Beta-lactamase regulating signal transducer with metallopeptidase domain n=1 Tax=Prosthecobacter dejongeii TaxID=48465 RepID=A0A7W8DN16_9BACT|nr:M56 family metallopeptidase [Prosthecobacter dejongeii]MBB5035852.1 beta-lactamase regulating signal transducer with metallopeptidase domain [Prosthecobacter dejongeii]